MKHPTENAMQPSLGDDMYDQWHGQTMLQLNPVLSQKLKLLPFKFASYDKTKGQMDFFDPARKDDFESISGSKMRKMARSAVEGAWQLMSRWSDGCVKRSRSCSNSTTCWRVTHPSSSWI